jgi:hypothetical protein
MISMRSSGYGCAGPLSASRYMPYKAIDAVANTKRSSLRVSYWQRCIQEVHKARVCRTDCLCQMEVNLLAFFRNTLMSLRKRSVLRIRTFALFSLTYGVVGLFWEYIETGYFSIEGPIVNGVFLYRGTNCWRRRRDDLGRTGGDQDRKSHALNAVHEGGRN